MSTYHNLCSPGQRCVGRDGGGPQWGLPAYQESKLVLGAARIFNPPSTACYSAEFSEQERFTRRAVQTCVNVSFKTRTSAKQCSLPNLLQLLPGFLVHGLPAIPNQHHLLLLRDRITILYCIQSASNFKFGSLLVKALRANNSEYIGISIIHTDEASLEMVELIIYKPVT